MSQKFLNPVEVNGQVSAEYLDLSTSTTHSVNAGEIAWNSIDGTFDIGLLNGVTLQAGQEMHFYGKATEAISNGNAVMFAGVQGDHILIAKADAVTINANPEYFMGIATQDFAINDFGYVTAFGNVRGIDTSIYGLGDILYYDSTTGIDGLLTPTMPSAPKAKIIVAAVVKVHATQGILAVRPHTMPRLKDIQDINVDTASAGEILQLQSDGVWENKTLSEAGIVSGTGTTNYVSKFTGSDTLGNSQIFDNGTNIGIGTSSPIELMSLYKSTRPYISIQNATTGTTSNDGMFFGHAFGDLDFEIRNKENSAITVWTNNAERMRITSTGNVGIGTTAPSTKLHVSGAGAFGGIIYPDYNTDTGTRIDGATVNQLKLFADSYLVGFVGGSEKYACSTSQLYTAAGINLSSGGRLYVTTVDNAASDTDKFLVLNGTEVEYRTGTQLLSDIGGQASLTNPVTGTGNTNYLPKFTGTTSLGNSQIFDNGTNVGIGAASPSTKLHIEGSLKQQNKAYYNTIQSVGTLGTVKWTLQESNGTNVTTSSTNKVYRVQLVTMGTGTNTGATWIASNVDAAGWSIKVVNANTVSGSNYPYMIVDTDGLPKVTTSHPSNYNVSISVEEFDGSNNGTTTGVFGLDDSITAVGGNVGIGTTSPSEKLHIAGDTLIDSNGSTPDATTSTYTEGLTITGGNMRLVIDTSNVTNGGSYIQTRHSSTSFPSAFYTLALNPLGGNVGIGTSSPNSLLTLNGASGLSVLELRRSNTGVSGGKGAIGFKSLNDYFTAGITELTDSGNDNGGSLVFRAMSNSSTNNIYAVTERMRITSTGVVGFNGSSSPNNAGLNKLSIGFLDDNYGWIQSWSSRPLSLNPLGNNVGIGTSSPTANLSVVSPTGTDALVRIIGGNYGTERDARLFLGELDDSGMTFEYDGVANMGYIGMNLSTDPTGSWSKRIQMSRNGSEVAFMAGKVGIGTASPNLKLHTEGSVNGEEGLRIRNTSNGTDATAMLRLNNDSGTSSSSQVLMFLNSSTRLNDGGVNTFSIRNNIGSIRLMSTSSGTVSFWTSVSDERMRIDASGNVGIGTSSPAYKLDVNGNTNIASSSSTGSPFLAFSQSTTRRSFIQHLNSGQNLAIVSEFGGVIFNAGGTNTERMRITSTGSVGIGTTAPLEKLDVSGDIIMTDTITGQANLKSLFGTIVSHNLITQNYGFANNAIISNPVSTETIFNTAGTEVMRIAWTNNVGIGTSSPAEAAILHLESNKKGFLPPVMLDSEVQAISNPKVGLMAFASDSDRMYVYTSEGWKALAYQ